jgi:DNA polymerase I-like protein with 3'-5' exonuclease and polymerase domains
MEVTNASFLRSSGPRIEKEVCGRAAPAAANEARRAGTRYAAWLICPKRERIHDLGSLLERHLQVKIPKELGGSDWGGMLLTEEQLEYARNDVRYLHRLKDQLSQELKALKLEAVFALECKLLPIVARMEIHGFAVDAAWMREMRDAARKKADDIAAGVCTAFGNQKLNPGSNPQLLAAFEANGVKLENTSEDPCRTG